MPSLDRVAADLDAVTASRVRPALAWLRSQDRDDPVAPARVQTLLRRHLPQAWSGQGREQHEVAWALGDLFEQAGLVEQARLCRSSATHELLAVWQWTQGFTDVPQAFWTPALTALERGVTVPTRATLSLSSARALLQVVGDGLELTSDGQLPLATVLGLDDRFRWTEEFPWMRATEENALAPLRLLRDHLVAQRLLAVDGQSLTRTALGSAGLASTPRLWRAVVDPAPRWSREFERDALGVMAVSVLRSADFALGRIAEEMTRVLAGRWRPVGEASAGRMFDGAAPVAQAWYQLGVPLGWWDTGRGAADRVPNVFGRAAALAVLRAVAGPARAARSD